MRLSNGIFPVVPTRSLERAIVASPGECRGGLKREQEKEGRKLNMCENNESEEWLDARAQDERDERAKDDVESAERAEESFRNWLERQEIFFDRRDPEHEDK